jgi:murein DD-endopeptidase MepM/ murein hydrolase activator NlpD
MKAQLSSMTARWLIRLATVQGWFPERQIYIRSEGRVQFFTLGRKLQAAGAGISLIFLGWTAFSTVTVVFKDRIVQAQDHRLQRVQEAFEARLADLQLSYDNLQVSAANIRSRADQLLAAREEREAKLWRALGPAPAFARTNSNEPMPNGQNAVAGAGLFGRTLAWISQRQHRTASALHNPNLAALTRDTAALSTLGQDATGVMQAVEAKMAIAVVSETGLIATTGLKPVEFLRASMQSEGVGGPEISLDGMRLSNVSDSAFNQAYFRAEANDAALDTIDHAVQRLPVTPPVGAHVARSSGFGPRLDPFTGRYAFHPGLDFAGPTGTPVTATGAGRVVFAGRDGGYGNMVELDHGGGIHTRYAHLLSTAVTVGQSIAKGAVVGHMGSTGRSTGPHVHYEIWFNDVVRNPDGFLRLGQLERSHAF